MAGGFLKKPKHVRFTLRLPKVLFDELEAKFSEPIPVDRTAIILYLIKKELGKLEREALNR